MNLPDQGSIQADHPQGRFYFLDNLRSVIVLLVVIYHAAIAYMINCPKWFYVIDTQSNLFFNVFVIINDVFLMPVMFFIAGFFGIRSLVRKPQLVFWQDKIVRLVIPYFVGILFLAPAINYIYFLSRPEVPPPYLYYWGNIFFNLARQHAHFWFLGLLVLFFLLLSLIYRFYKPLGQVSDIPAIPTVKFFIGCGLLTSAVFFGVHQIFDDSTWLMLQHVLMIQPTRCTLYIFYFALGVYAHRQQWFSISGYAPITKYWVPLSVLLGSVYAGYKIILWPKRQLMLVMIGNDILQAFFCLTAIFALLAFFQQRFNYSSNLWQKLSANSYAIYFIHQPIVMLLLLAVRGFPLNVFVKYLLVSAAAVTVSYLVCEYGLSKIPSFSNKNKPRQPGSDTVVSA